MAVSAPQAAPKGATRSWDTLGLSEWVLNAVASLGFTRPTPVQSSTIGLALGNKDVVVEAVTGSGKTLAFLIPVVEKLLRFDEPTKKHHVGAIIISPTRELASQIYSVLVSLLGFHPPSAAALRPTSDDDEVLVQQFSSSTPKIVPQLLVGGSQTPAQDLAHFLANSPNVLVATPGRLLEILGSSYVHCPQSSFEILILDEADRLLDLGFKDDLQKILSRLPKQRRTGLFSASVSEAVDQIIRVGLRNPVKIAVRVKNGAGTLDKRTPISLQMAYAVQKPTEKLPALAQLFEKLMPMPQKSIVYFSTCAQVDYMQHVLPVVLSDFSVVPLHGKHPPNVRQRNFKRFTESIAPTVLLTTDVAARGIDIPTVDLVVQLDPPSDPKVFLHRCGRAGRAGRRGLSVVFLTEGREEDYVPFLAVRKTPVTLLQDPVLDVSESQCKNITNKIRKVVLTDRAIHDKAQKAFVSWVKSYSKHHASSIFRVSDLDWQELGNAWGLLKLPRMPELKGFDGDRSLGLDLNFDSYQYKDKAREKRRLEPRVEAEEASNLKKAKQEAWSEKKGRKETREVRREKRTAKREKERISKMTDEERRDHKELNRMIDEVRRQNLEAQEEWKGFSD